MQSHHTTIGYIRKIKDADLTEHIGRNLVVRFLTTSDRYANEIIDKMQETFGSAYKYVNICDEAIIFYRSDVACYYGEPEPHKKSLQFVKDNITISIDYVKRSNGSDWCLKQRVKLPESPTCCTIC